MARKKKQWTVDDIVLLSAYLDFYAEKRKGLGKWSIGDILSKLKKHIKGRSSQQIERKLLSLWGSSDPNLSRETFQDVFKNGSRCLKRLSDDLRPRVRAELLVIQDNELSQRLDTPQTLRSGRKRSVSIDIRRHSPYRGKSEPKTPTKSPSKRLRGPTLQHSSLPNDGQTCGVSEVLSTPSTASNSRAVKLEIPAITGMRSPLSRELADTNGSEVVDDVCLEIADSFEGVAEVDLEEATTHPSTSGIQMTRKRLFQVNVPHAPSLDYEQLTINSPAAVQRSSAQEIYGMLHDLVNDNTHFRQKYSELAQKQAENQIGRRLLESLERLSSEDPNWSIFSVVQQKHETIEKRDRSLRDQAFLQPFLDASYYHRNHLDLRKIEDALRAVKSAIYCLARTRGLIYTLSILHFESEDLKTLIDRFRGCDLLRSLSEQKVSQLTSDRLSGLIMQSLVGAAVCEWVFLSEIHCAAMLSTPLHETYKHHLRSLCKFAFIAQTKMGTDKIPK